MTQPSLKQSELFEDEALAPVYKPYMPDPAEIRAKLQGMLDELRGEALYGDARRLAYVKTVFPQMINWLPKHEAEDLLRAFRASLPT